MLPPLVEGQIICANNFEFAAHLSIQLDDDKYHHNPQLQSK